MFSLWYTLLSWKEYKTSILARKQKADQGPAEETEVKPEVPKVVPAPVNSVDPNENIAPIPQLPQSLHQSTPKSTPISLNTVIETSFPGSTPTAQDHLNPPPKPPRSPSPHPMRAENYDIEFSSEESDEYDDEEEEPNSVIDSTVIEQKSKAANIEEFLSTEINGLKREST